ncbi:MAG: malate dehydrogenase [Campylobacteraceae bacterium]|jgi:malate dehydrogenase (oxaloacetate-decarboxylating)(NADP+)|nr:malate dehydrogenase [Campylobacteraceae bacterium]
MSKITEQEVLDYHIGGKIEVNIKSQCKSSRDLSMAYTPGVAIPCLEIERDNDLAYAYTNKSNLVAVVTNSTSILGLGKISPVAGKPVMEGKAVLFKKFADIDAFDIEVDAYDIDSFVEIVSAISPTFGGINLEDIKAPECFEIEAKLQDAVDIPIMHDDQHGTAIITSAGLINALEISGKNIADIKIVVLGAGAAGTACAKMYRALGAKNIVMVDSKGVIYKGREEFDAHKGRFAIDTKDRNLSDAMNGADMFLGLSRARLLTQDMVKSMNKNPIIFALANPTPEILPEEVVEVRDDVIMGTGRSDYPNQVNNVLGFPFIFRGALDVRAKKITENMKMAAALALAKLAKEPVPDYIKDAYNGREFSFGKDYVIPKPFDKRALASVASAVAKAAVDEGVARVKDFDINAYIKNLEEKIK